MPSSPEPDPAADLELVERALRGDAGAMEAVSARLGAMPKLIAAANRRLASPLPPEELADVTQDSFLAIWQKLETYGGRGTLEGWAWTYGFNFLRNRVRSVARQRRQSGPLVAQVDGLAAPSSDPMPFDPDDLKAALASLPEEMAEVIRLKHDEGLMFKDIADRLDIATGTAKTRYYRGVTRLRDLLTARHSPAKGDEGARS
ncbi:MAG: sigma-70 family RNA polymerase sigma factor [Planctomycetota bacterium]